MVMRYVFMAFIIRVFPCALADFTDLKRRAGRPAGWRARRARPVMFRRGFGAGRDTSLQQFLATMALGERL
jgi:hypothetical protein